MTHSAIDPISYLERKRGAKRIAPAKVCGALSGCGHIRVGERNAESEDLPERLDLHVS